MNVSAITLGRMFGIVAAAVVIAGCSPPRALMPTPLVYAAGAETAFENSLPDDLRVPDMSIIYATDRVLEKGDGGALTYGIGRSFSLGMGEATVGFGKDTSWQDLVADANTSSRRQPLRMKIEAVQERSRTPGYPFRNNTPDAVEALAQEQQAYSVARQLLNEKLAKSPRKEVMIFVHGVAIPFEESIYTTAELWHYMGREIVPIAYSWPAGQGGVLRGYAHDRESGELTVFHLRRYLKWVSSLPEVEGVHLIAHSRGTDVTVSTLRELAIEALARNESLHQRYKLRNVVLAAPDISGEVGFQRLVDGGTNLISDRWTTYTSPGDTAIGVAEFLFGGERLGRLLFDNLSQEDREEVEQMAGFFDQSDATIRYNGRLGGKFGHEYFRTDPVVSSDLILAIRFDRDPGPANGRPLNHLGSLFWTIDGSFYEKGPD